MTKSTISRRGALAAGLAALAAPALAQGAWPGRFITFVVPFPPGGTSDLMGRFVAQELSKALGTTVVVENRAGANGNVGSASVLRAPADGNTLLLSGVGSHGINAALYRAMPYDPVRDFTHVTMIASGPNAIAVHPSFAARTLGDLVAMVRREPGKHNYASSGIGSSSHMAMELFKQKAGLEIEHVPYRGGAAALTDVMAGQVPVLITNADAVLPHSQEGRLRVLAVTSAERSAMFPQVATISEAGFAEVVAVSWTGVSAPAGTSGSVLQRLQQEVSKAVNGPLKERLATLGLVPGGNSSEDYTAFVASEVSKWRQVAQVSKITAE
ncbi:Tripartite-type tricarboxylate transporter, receptor component TctC [Roseomonas rosea]|uniref:Tripartite-type tricarboxylate transporter, receptor component TctC n=1 Tax=Muricoccus roseus TaxID=198092 RepID=A0A1M6CGC3_9PROT|nr:tripartite tricarboxylate transporter substrate binding protein [Roseomonas rosea]SHI59794.1 Tripartite-type tricarboxylate transporter, receptor component TctC [Roseomonas rosea]